jgi:antitoxin component YwqK of YwqJK toxin-antitoxin module
MKTIVEIMFVLLFAVSTMSAQENAEFTREGDQIKVAYFYEDAQTLKETGYFKDGVSNGRWVQYNRDGEVKIEAYYKNGSKEGTWFVWADDGESLFELEYAENRLVNSHKWTIEQKDMLAKN